MYYMGYILDDDSYSNFCTLSACNPYDIAEKFQNMYPGRTSFKKAEKMTDKERYEIEYEEDGEKGFAVCEIFEIEEDKSAAFVSWHGFNGVDFNLIKTDSLEEARQLEYTAVENYILENDFDDYSEYQKDLIIIDVGDEWKMFQTIDLIEAKASGLSQNWHQ